MRLFRYVAISLALSCLFAACGDDKPESQQGATSEVPTEALLSDFDKNELALMSAGCGFQVTKTFEGFVEEQYEVKLKCLDDPQGNSARGRKQAAEALMKSAEALAYRSLTKRQRLLVDSKASYLPQIVSAADSRIAEIDARLAREARERAERVARDRRAREELEKTALTKVDELKTLGCRVEAYSLKCPMSESLDAQASLLEKVESYAKDIDSMSGRDYARFPSAYAAGDFRSSISKALTAAADRMSVALGKTECPSLAYKCVVSRDFYFRWEPVNKIREAIRAYATLERALGNAAVKAKLTSAVGTGGFYSIRFGLQTQISGGSIDLNWTATEDEIAQFVLSQTFTR